MRVFAVIDLIPQLDVNAVLVEKISTISRSRTRLTLSSPRLGVNSDDGTSVLAFRENFDFHVKTLIKVFMS